MVYGGLGTNAHSVGQTSPLNQGSNSNERAAKRVRNFESRNLERGFAELSIHPTLSVPSLPHIEQQQQQQQPDTQLGGDGVWSSVVGNDGQSSNTMLPDGSTLPLLRSSSVVEPPSPDIDDIQMSTPTWYEPEKDSEFVLQVVRYPLPLRRFPRSSRSHCILMILGITGIVITSLDDGEYDGDDEGQKRQRTGTNSAAQESNFTISPAFLNAINRKLIRTEDPPAPPTDVSSSQALVLFRPLPVIALPPEEDDLKDFDKGGMLDSSLPRPPPPSPSMSSPFYVQDPGRPPFVCTDDDMEMEML